MNRSSNILLRFGLNFGVFSIFLIGLLMEVMVRRLGVLMLNIHNMGRFVVHGVMGLS